MEPVERVGSNAVVRICHTYHLKELSVFGSTANGAARPDSDVDAFVEPDYDYHPTLFDTTR